MINVDSIRVAEREIVGLQVLIDSGFEVKSNDVYQSVAASTVKDFYLKQHRKLTPDQWSEILQILVKIFQEIAKVLNQKIKIFGWLKVGSMIVELAIFFIKNFKSELRKFI